MSIIRDNGRGHLYLIPPVLRLLKGQAQALEIEILSVLGADIPDTPESHHHRALPHLSIWESFSQFRAIFVGLLVPFISL